MQVKKNQKPAPLTGEKVKALLPFLPALVLCLLLIGIHAAYSQDLHETGGGFRVRRTLPDNVNKSTHERAVNPGSSNARMTGPINSDSSNKNSVAVRQKNRADAGVSTDTSANSQDDDSNGKSLGWMEVDLPDRVKLGKQFDIDIWLHPSDAGYKGTAKVFMEQTDRVEYDPRVFDLKTGERKTIKAQVVATQAGLTEIRASADDWEDFSIPLDAGFSAKLKADNIPDSIDGGTIQDFNFSFVDDHGERVRLDAPVKITFQSSKLQMSVRGNSNWGTEVNMDIPAGSSSIPTLEVRPQVWTTTDVGTIQDTIRLDEDTVLSDQTLPQIKIKPRWWIPLLLAMLGGVLFGLYKITQEFSSYTGGFRQSFVKATIQRIAPGALAGALAYLLANYEVIGFKADTTELRGYLILGFLFAYVGIDTILKLLNPAKNPKEESPQAQPAQ